MEQYLRGETEVAFHGLLEVDNEGLPELTNAFRRTANAQLGAFLLKVIWQHRHPSVIPLLAESLFVTNPSVWREAIDGLVSMGSTEATSALCTARHRVFQNERDAKDFRTRLEEAIAQATSG